MCKPATKWDSAAEKRNLARPIVIPKSSEESRRGRWFVGIPHYEDFVRNDN